jgi:hypothetical protein
MAKIKHCKLITQERINTRSLAKSLSISKIRDKKKIEFKKQPKKKLDARYKISPKSKGISKKELKVPKKSGKRGRPRKNP